MTDPTITPPPELVQRWRYQVSRYRDVAEREETLIERAAQWGYELRNTTPTETNGQA